MNFLALVLAMLFNSQFSFGGVAEDLVRATTSGLAFKVQTILEENPQLNLGAIRIDGRGGLLHLALWGGSLEVVKMFLDQSASAQLLAMQDENGDPPLASLGSWKPMGTREFLKVLQLVLKRPDSREILAIRCRNGDTLMHRIVYWNEPEVMRLLLDHPAYSELLSLKDESPLGSSAMHLAVSTGTMRVGKIVLDALVARRDLSSLEVLDNSGTSALGLAGSLGRDQTVFEFWEAGVPLDAVMIKGIPSSLRPVIERVMGRALLEAVKRRDALAVQQILDENPNLDLVSVRSWDKSGLLHEAVLNPHIEVVKILLSRPESSELLRMTDVHGFTPLHVAAFQGDNVVLKMILDREDSPELLHARDSNGRVPLAVALLLVAPRAVELILKSEGGVSSNEILNKDKTSPLGEAISSGRAFAVSQFVRAGVSLEEVSIAGEKISARTFLEKLGERPGGLSITQGRILDLILRGDLDSNPGWKDEP